MKCNEYETKSGKPIRLWQGNCMELMDGKPENHWDLAIVDPPYGIDIAKNGSLNTTTSKKQYKVSNWDSQKPTKVYFEKLKSASSRQIVWGGNYFPELWEKPCRGFIYWNKLNHFDERADGELAWYSEDALPRHFEYMWDGNRYGFKDGKKNGVGEPSKRIHPTQKPVDLHRWLLTNYAEENDTILDTHGGSMSLAISCYIEDFELDIIELDEDYYNDAVERFERHIAQKTLF